MRAGTPWRMSQRTWNKAGRAGGTSRLFVTWPRDSQDGRNVMLYWALVFFVVALIAGALGFGGIASASAGIAQVLFVIFLILLVASLVMHFLGARRRRL